MVNQQSCGETIGKSIGKWWLNGGCSWDLMGFDGIYPLVNVYIAMENSNFEWGIPPFLWPFSIARLNYQRVRVDMM